MARTKAIWEGRYVPDSARPEGKDHVSFNVALEHDPDRAIRVTESRTSFERMVRDLRRAQERSAARDIFALGE